MIVGILSPAHFLVFARKPLLACAKWRLAKLALKKLYSGGDVEQPARRS